MGSIQDKATENKLNKNRTNKANKGTTQNHSRGKMIPSKNPNI